MEWSVEIRALSSMSIQKNNQIFRTISKKTRYTAYFWTLNGRSGNMYYNVELTHIFWMLYLLFWSWCPVTDETNALLQNMITPEAPNPLSGITCPCTSLNIHYIYKCYKENSEMLKEIYILFHEPNFCTYSLWVTLFVTFYFHIK
jgi:hypothetical protein